MPGESGTFDPHWKIAHAGKDRQSTKQVRFFLFVQATDHLCTSFSQLFNCFASIIESKLSARGGRDIQSSHHGLRAVMTGTHRDALLIQDRPDVVGMYAVNCK